MRAEVSFFMSRMKKHKKNCERSRRRPCPLPCARAAALDIVDPSVDPTENSVRIEQPMLAYFREHLLSRYIPPSGRVIENVKLPGQAREGIPSSLQCGTHHVNVTAFSIPRSCRDTKILAVVSYERASGRKRASCLAVAMTASSTSGIEKERR